MEKRDEVKALRKALELTQNDLAKVLGVTKTTVSRYEMRNGFSPQGEVDKKISQLTTLIQDKEQLNKLLEIRRKGGLVALAAIIGMAAVIYPVSAAVSGISLNAILKSQPAQFLGKTISSVLRK